MATEIRDFKGVFTNADQEDISDEYLSVLKNLRPENGRLIKTSGSVLVRGDLDQGYGELQNFYSYVTSSGENVHFLVFIGEDNGVNIVSYIDYT